MKSILIFLLLFGSIISFGQEKLIRPSGNKQLNYLGKSSPLQDKEPLKPAAFNPDKPGKRISISSNRFNRSKDASVQRFIKEGDSIECIVNFEGVAGDQIPNPDTQGDVGPDHYFQMVKRSFSIWDKQGELLFGPADNQTIWSDFSGPWDDLGWTDPVVIYDHLADRWLASCMVYDVNVEYFEMIAVSATSDPLGEYYCYSLWFETMPDYPKFGLWPDGYYLTVNEAEVANYWGTFVGPSILVFNREQMINGDPNPQMLYFHLDAPNQSFTEDIASFLPSDLDGPPPPAGTPNYHLCMKDDAFGYDEDRLWLWECSVDWNDTASSYFSEVGVLATEAFDSHNDTMEYIHQPILSVRLTSLSHFLMYRLQYRSFGDYQSLVCNHTVEVDGEDHAAVRWYELRDEGDGWFIRQQSSLAPDADSRWMGSLAMDKDGNIGLGYSVSGDLTYPSIRMSGQRYFDEPGIMTFTESEIMEGTANQTQHGRWGDYSTMSIDPVDNLTFWYTQMYYEVVGPTTWQTRVASFQLHKNLSFQNDTTSFLSASSCVDGMPLIVKNNSMYPVQILSVQEEGNLGSAQWHVEYASLSFPYELNIQDSLVLTVFVDLPTEPADKQLLIDSIEIITDYTNHYPIIVFDDDILAEVNSNIIANGVLKVFPNPFSKSTTIEVNIKHQGLFSLHILDQTKKVVRTPYLNKQAVNVKYTFEWDGRNETGDNISNGIYFVVLNYEGKEIIRKVIIQ